ncbi:MAG: hypothetical protein ABSE59_11510 [Opitutaceae bacterium]|jgi:hypothetical protein
MKTCLLIDAYYLQEFISLGLMSRWEGTAKPCHTTLLAYDFVERSGMDVRSWVGPNRLAVHSCGAAELRDVILLARKHGCSLHEASVEFMAHRLADACVATRRSGKQVDFDWVLGTMERAAVLTKAEAIVLSRRWTSGDHDLHVLPDLKLHPTAHQSVS